MCVVCILFETEHFFSISKKTKKKRRTKKLRCTFRFLLTWYAASVSCILRMCHDDLSYLFIFFLIKMNIQLKFRFVVFFFSLSLGFGKEKEFSKPFKLNRFVILDVRNSYKFVRVKHQTRCNAIAHIIYASSHTANKPKRNNERAF